ncbi:MAG TPA: exodeoxyribonuclease VII large subunit [Anaerolineales bacterium]
MQPSLFASHEWTVSDLTRYIRDRLESDVSLQDLWVHGEISNLSRPASGHLYFTLKDAGASLRIVMWRTSAMRLSIGLQDGMAVAVHGKIGVYEVAGQYQLYAELIRPAGEGALYQEFLRLKAVLEGEGLFDSERKRPIPALSSRIGIVTSPTGAALHDMLDTLGRRLPMLEVVIAPSPVQGDEAPAGLVQAIRALNRLRRRPDVILLARGGGSIEDLWAFNDERVVRAVAASEIPIICGVGHETDFTLADFAADLRAPTPTAAAELATQITAATLKDTLLALSTQLTGIIRDVFVIRHDGLALASTELRFHSPARRIESGRQRLDDLARRAEAGVVHHFALQSSTLDGIQKRLESLNPAKVLARGYAVVRRRDGTIIHKVSQARDAILIRVSDGEFEAEVRKGRTS